MSDAGTTDGPVWDDERITALVPWTVIRAMLLVTPRLGAALAPHGLSPTQFGVLVQVDNDPGVTQAVLARRCLMTPQSMGEVLPPLEQAGWLVRGARSGRGHPIPVHITPAGRDLLRAATPDVEATNTPETLGLDADESATLNALLHKLATAHQVSGS